MYVTYALIEVIITQSSQPVCFIYREVLSSAGMPAWFCVCPKVCIRNAHQSHSFECQGKQTEQTAQAKSRTKANTSHQRHTCIGHPGCSAANDAFHIACHTRATADRSHMPVRNAIRTSNKCHWNAQDMFQLVLHSTGGVGQTLMLPCAEDIHIRTALNTITIMMSWHLNLNSRGCLYPSCNCQALHPPFVVCHSHTPMRRSSHQP